MSQTPVFDIDQFKDSNLDKELENLLNYPAPPYGDLEYWNNRYENEDIQFEWYLPWSTLRDHLIKHIQPTGIALNIGCGNSAMSFDLLKEGFSKVISIDFSQVVIRKMREKYTGETKLEWEAMDITRNPLPNHNFDFIFDKATLDTLICNDNTSGVVQKLLKEVNRLLKPGGYFILISYGVPNTRKNLFVNPLTLVETVQIEKPGISSGSYYYVYIVKKSE